MQVIVILFSAWDSTAFTNTGILSVLDVRMPTEHTFQNCAYSIFSHFKVTLSLAHYKDIRGAQMYSC
jgi:hypothetical protein